VSRSRRAWMKSCGLVSAALRGVGRLGTHEAQARLSYERGVRTTSSLTPISRTATAARLEDRLVLERRLRPVGAVSATKCAVIMLAAGMLVMTVEPTQALASPGPNAHTARKLASSARQAQATPHADHADPVVLARGSGYGGGAPAALVRALQRRLDRAGFPAGPIDGLYGPRTEAAVTAFQSAHGLRVDGIAGPITLSALRSPSTVLYPGAGYAGLGSGQVRALQRQLRREGYSPGPIDGRYGPLTEHAVSRFQAAHGLPVNGTAGPRTFGQLKRIAAESRTAPRPRPSAPRTRRSRPRVTQSPTPGAPQGVGPRTATGANHGGASWPVALALIGLACLAALISGVWLIERRRRASNAVLAQAGAAAAPAEAGEPASGSEAGPANGSEAGPANGSEAARASGLEGHGHVDAAELAYHSADQQGDATAASNLGVMLERRGDVAGAEAAYRRADERGSADGAFNLAGLLLERGDMEGAMAAYRRADQRGDAGAAANLAALLLHYGDEAGAEEAFSRADERGDMSAAANLGALLEHRGNLPAAEAAYRRADAGGSADGAAMLGALLERRGDLAGAVAAYQRADGRGDAEAAAKLGMLLERRHDYHAALEAYTRAQRSDEPEVAELARLRARALALGLSVAGERGER